MCIKKRRALCAAYMVLSKIIRRKNFHMRRAAVRAPHFAPQFARADVVARRDVELARPLVCRAFRVIRAAADGHQSTVIRAAVNK